MKFDYLVIAGGKIPPFSFVKRLLKISKHVVTVDRGAATALNLKIKPLLHVGDNDSFSQGKIKLLKSQSIITLDKKKSISDLEYAIDVISKESSQKTILVIGAHFPFEERFDHAFVNLILLAKSDNLYFADDKNWFTSTRPAVEISFKPKRETLFSLVAFDKKKAKVKIQGAQYEGLCLLQRPSHGLSNKTKGKVKVVADSKVLLFVNSDITKTMLTT